MFSNFVPVKMQNWLTLEEAREGLMKGRGRGVRIAILDSGVEFSHPLLKNVKSSDDLAIVEEGFSLRAISGEGRDVFGHGTAVCGIIHQLAPEAEIGSFRVLGEQLRSKSFLIREGARLAIERNYDILN